MTGGVEPESAILVESILFQSIREHVWINTVQEGLVKFTIGEKVLPLFFLERDTGTPQCIATEHSHSLVLKLGTVNLGSKEPHVEEAQILVVVQLGSVEPLNELCEVIQDGTAIFIGDLVFEILKGFGAT